MEHQRSNSVGLCHRGDSNPDHRGSDETKSIVAKGWCIIALVQSMTFTSTSDLSTLDGAKNCNSTFSFLGQGCSKVCLPDLPSCLTVQNSISTETYILITFVKQHELCLPCASIQFNPGSYVGVLLWGFCCSLIVLCLSVDELHI